MSSFESLKSVAKKAEAIKPAELKKLLSDAVKKYEDKIEAVVKDDTLSLPERAAKYKKIKAGIVKVRADYAKYLASLTIEEDKKTVRNFLGESDRLAKVLDAKIRTLENGIAMVEGIKKRQSLQKETYKTSDEAERPYKEEQEKEARAAAETLKDLPSELAPLRNRFYGIPDLQWTPELQKALEAKKDIIAKMESAGHEPTVVKIDNEIYIVSGATEAPASTKNKTYAEAAAAATGLGVNLMSEAQYRGIKQWIGRHSIKSWTWLETPGDILKGGHAFAGVESGYGVDVFPCYANERYGSRGWRASLRVSTEPTPTEQPTE